MNDKLKLAVKLLNESPLPLEIRELAIKRLGERDVLDVQEYYKTVDIINYNFVYSYTTEDYFAENFLEGVDFWEKVWRVLRGKDDGLEWPVIPKSNIVFLNKGDLFPDYSVFWDEENKKFRCGRDRMSGPEAQEILEISIELYKTCLEKGFTNLSINWREVVITVYKGGKINIGCQKTTLDKIQAALEKIKTFT